MARGRKRATADLTDEFVRCRAVGHSWDDFHPTDMRRPLFGWRLSFRCTRCLTERHDLVDAMGRLLQRSYYYDDDYKEAGIGLKGVRKDDFRREMALRTYGRLRERNKQSG